MDFDPVCAIVGLLFAVRRIVVMKAQGSRASWMIVGGVELIYCYVWACTPLVISLAQRFPLTGPRAGLRLRFQPRVLSPIIPSRWRLQYLSK